MSSNAHSSIILAVVKNIFCCLSFVHPILFRTTLKPIRITTRHTAVKKHQAIAGIKKLFFIINCIVFNDHNTKNVHYEPLALRKWQEIKYTTGGYNYEVENAYLLVYSLR